MSPTPNTLFTQRRLTLALGAAAVVMALGFVAFRMGPMAPTKITVDEVKTEDLRPSVFGIGSVEAQQTWLMGPTMSGRVSQVFVDVGQTVRTGQWLAEMDPVDLSQRLRAQDAALAKAASMETAVQAQLADAKAKQSLAVVNLKRQQELARQHFISPSALEGREQELRSADAALLSAQANLQAAKLETQRWRAERAAIVQQLANTRLAAPANAVVVSREAEPGSTVVAGQAIVRLVNPDSLWVKLRVDQGRSSGLQAGLPARIVLRSQPRQVLTGHVVRVELQADSVTEERIAQVAFDQKPPSLSMGEMAEVTLDLPPLAHVRTLPQASVQTHQGHTGAWRLKDGALAFAPVQWGKASLDGRIQVISGLEPGDTVVTHSEKPITAGTRFKVVETLAPRTTP